MNEPTILNPSEFGKHEELATRIQGAIAQLRPYLEADEGNITLVAITDDLNIKLKLHGSCVDCSLINMTMKGGVESAIRSVAPEVFNIDAINI